MRMKSFIKFNFYIRFSLKFLCFWVIFIILLVLISTGRYQHLLAIANGLNYVHNGPPESLPELIARWKTNSIPKSYPLNRFPYDYIHMNKEKCDNNLKNEGVSIIFLVKSTVNNFENRKVIRETWGKHRSMYGNEINSVFLLGIRTLNSELQKSVNSEDELFQDIVQAEFIDTYDNNTLKTTMAFDWSFKYCKNVDYYIFVDDDYFVSIDNLFTFLRNPTVYPNLPSESVPLKPDSNRELWAGYVYPRSMPFRYYQSKWYISINEYPYTFYPPYVTGGLFILSEKSFKDLYFAYLFTELFKIDDVYLGMCASKANLTPVHSNEFAFARRSFSKENYRNLIASHGFRNPQLMREIAFKVKNML